MKPKVVWYVEDLVCAVVLDKGLLFLCSIFNKKFHLAPE